MLRASEFVQVPPELEARRPAELRGLSRDGVSMLVSDVRANTHQVCAFRELPQLLNAGDLLVVNDSATLPSALPVRRSNGKTIGLHVSTQISGQLCIVEPRNAGLLAARERFTAPAAASIELLSPVHRERPRLWYALVELPCPLEMYLRMYARPISYAYVRESFPISAYQTIFARIPGSSEMPSAGRPFTLRVLDEIHRRGVHLAPITLHCGVASPESHEPPAEERFVVPHWTAEAINERRAMGARIVAVGTTVVRAIESAIGSDGRVQAASGWTGRIVDPLHPPRAVDGLLTGLHEPKASHLRMLAAFTDEPVLEAAYAVALDQRLLWHEFGDVHLIYA